MGTQFQGRIPTFTMDRKGLVCSVLLLLSLLQVSSAVIRELQSINDLRTIEFGHRYPRHGLKLLFWFAQQLTINADTDPISVSFNARRLQYGFHSFTDTRALLPAIDLPTRLYVAVGNLNTRTNPGASSLPNYVVYDYRAPYTAEKNMDRIIVKIPYDRLVVEDVYITQHQPESEFYDQANTYKISVRLLREIRTQRDNQAFLRVAGYVARNHG